MPRDRGSGVRILDVVAWYSCKSFKLNQEWKRNSTGYLKGQYQESRIQEHLKDLMVLMELLWELSLHSQACALKLWMEERWEMEGRTSSQTSLHLVLISLLLVIVTNISFGCCFFFFARGHAIHTRHLYSGVGSLRNPWTPCPPFSHWITGLSQHMHASCTNRLWVFHTLGTERQSVALLWSYSLIYGNVGTSWFHFILLLFFTQYLNYFLQGSCHAN